MVCDMAKRFFTCCSATRRQVQIEWQHSQLVLPSCIKSGVIIMRLLLVAIEYQVPLALVLCTVMFRLSQYSLP